VPPPTSASRPPTRSPSFRSSDPAISPTPASRSPTCIATHAILARLLADTALELDDEISASVVEITIPVLLTIEDVNLVRLRIVDLVP
jgi:hypothetical protein